MDEKLLEAYILGIYYEPASSHYKKICNVICNRCNTSNLLKYVGYNDIDLCMVCVDDMSLIFKTKMDTAKFVACLDSIYNDVPSKQMRDVHDIPVTMRQKIFNKENKEENVEEKVNLEEINSKKPMKIHTRMCQSMYNSRFSRLKREQEMKDKSDI